MSTVLDQPPKPDPALSKAAGRRALIGQSLNQALFAARGYQVEVVYGKTKKERSRKDRIVLYMAADCSTVEDVR